MHSVGSTPGAMPGTATIPQGEFPPAKPFHDSPVASGPAPPAPAVRWDSREGVISSAVVFFPAQRKSCCLCRAVKRFAVGHSSSQ